MKQGIRIASALGCLAAVSVAASSLAQNAGTPQFRDAKTGKVWTSQNVSQDDKLAPANQPSSPADKAFDPQAQVASVGGVSVQRPKANLMGIVPITAGPNVPIVTLDGPSLQAIPGGRWMTVLYVTNNSVAQANAEVGCTFTNGGRTVQETRVIVPSAGPGERLGLPAYGPPTDIFVDRVLCRILTP
jgi:hypothetical protein